MDIKCVLKSLTEQAGVSGNEFPAANAAAELLKQYAEDVSVDVFGNVTGFVKSGREGAKTLMLDAHVDRVGYIVTSIGESGFLSVGACGSPDVKMLLAQSVTIHGKQKVRGVVSTLPPHVQKDSKAPEISDISIDIGMDKKSAEELISLGDVVTVDSEFLELYGDVVSAPAIDDRGGVAAILAALDMLGERKPAYDLIICFSAQEETGERGAKQAAFRVQPDECIAVDVSFGRTPDSEPKDTAELGSGVMIGFSASLDKKMSNALRALAIKTDIPFTCEVMPTSTGTNADAIGVAGKGVKCCTLSIPIRYMHTPVECVNIRDIETTASLISEYIAFRPRDEFRMDDVRLGRCGK